MPGAVAAETFAGVRPSNNAKLRKDLRKLVRECPNARARYDHVASRVSGFVMGASQGEAGGVSLVDANDSAPRLSNKVKLGHVVFEEIWVAISGRSNVSLTRTGLEIAKQDVPKLVE